MEIDNSPSATAAAPVTAAPLGAAILIPAIAPEVVAVPVAANPATAAVAPPRTKSQIRAAAVADGVAVKAKWKQVIDDAKSTWPKIAVEELAPVAGNFHRLAGLVQLRHQTRRAEADRQAKAFFEKHALTIV